VRTGFDPPRVNLVARRRGEPDYVRFLNSSGEAELLLTGLGAGTFEVRGHLYDGEPMVGATFRPLGEVTLDDGGEASLVVDLR
jgi:hypothetical protein